MTDRRLGIPTPRPGIQHFPHSGADVYRSLLATRNLKEVRCRRAEKPQTYALPGRFTPVPVDPSLEPLLCVSDRHVDWVGVFQQQVTCERGLTYRLLSIRQRSKDVYVPNVV